MGVCSGGLSCTTDEGNNLETNDPSTPRARIKIPSYGWAESPGCEPNEKELALGLFYTYRICIITTFRVQFDPEKNVANQKKHKVSLAEAEAVFYDDMALEREDNDHDEKRWVVMGQDATGRVLVVAYTYREPDFVRVISARVASKNEMRQYLGG